VTAKALRDCLDVAHRLGQLGCQRLDDHVGVDCESGDYCFNPNLLNVARRAWSAAMLF
jgi:hypothetical protein